MTCTNYEWINFAWFSLLNHKMLSLWHIIMYFEQPLNKVNTQGEEGNWLIEEKNQNLVGVILR